MLNVQNVGSIDPVGVAAMAPPDWFQDVASKASEEALKGALSKCKGANIAFKPMARAGQVARTIADVARTSAKSIQLDRATAVFIGPTSASASAAGSC